MPQNPDVAWALDDLAARGPALKRRRDYYEGRHVSVIPAGQSLSPLVQQVLEDLTDNLCDDVVDEPVSRLTISGWDAPETAGTAPRSDADAGGGTDTGTSAGALAQALWDMNRGDERADLLHRDAWGLGDGFAIVEKDQAERVRFYLQRPEQMAVRYDPRNPDRIQVAAKVWKDGARWRLNLYYPGDYENGSQQPGPGRLERWGTRGSSVDGGVPQAKAFDLVPGEPDEEGGVDDGTRPEWSERVPVFHFPADEVGGYGRSVLTDVIPLQDLLNKSVADLVVSMEDVALPQRWGIGVQGEYQEDGTRKPVRRKAARASDMITTGAKPGEAAFGQFPGADLTQFLKVQEGYRLEIARKGYLPASSVALDGGSASISGLSLLVQEGRQNKRVKRGQRNFGWEWRALMAYMLTLSGRRTEPDELDLTWAQPETRDELAQWELLVIKRDMGVPDRVLLVEGGYDPDDVDDWLEAADVEPGGRLAPPGAGIASVTMPGVPGGMAVDLAAPPVQPNGAARPAVPQG